MRKFNTCEVHIFKCFIPIKMIYSTFQVFGLMKWMFPYWNVIFFLGVLKFHLPDTLVTILI
jgi:hypothetical protein